MSDIVKNGSTASTSVIVNKVEKPDLGEVSNELLTLLDLKGIYPVPNPKDTTKTPSNKKGKCPHL